MTKNAVLNYTRPLAQPKKTPLYSMTERHAQTQTAATTTQKVSLHD